MKTFKKRTIRPVDPLLFIPSNNTEFMALEVWKKIEPKSPGSFNFYLWSIARGLPASKFGQFAAEIMQDPTIKNRGAVFVSKVISYFGITKSKLLCEPARNTE